MLLPVSFNICSFLANLNQSLQLMGLSTEKSEEMKSGNPGDVGQMHVLLTPVLPLISMVVWLITQTLPQLLFC